MISNNRNKIYTVKHRCKSVRTFTSHIANDSTTLHTAMTCPVPTCACRIRFCPARCAGRPRTLPWRCAHCATRAAPRAYIRRPATLHLAERPFTPDRYARFTPGTTVRNESVPKSIQLHSLITASFDAEKSTDRHKQRNEFTESA
jgi:hypothetical protein